MPVLAVAEELRQLAPQTQFLFIGTRRGPERAMVAALKLPFRPIFAARWRRFWTLKNLAAPVIFLFSLFQAWRIVKRFQPDVIFSAGGFVAVPVCWMGKLFKARIVIHQQDARIGLANRLIAPVANEVTAVFEETAKSFYSGSGLFATRLRPAAIAVGNPVRPDLLAPNPSVAPKFHLSGKFPLLLVLTGATGAEQVNQLISEVLPQLTESFQVVHQTGRGKNHINARVANYQAYELLEFSDYAGLLQRADAVVARAGLSTIAELSALGKASVIIPMPHTHQEDNAKILAAAQAAVVLGAGRATGSHLLAVLNELKFNPELAASLAANMRRLMPAGAAEKIARLILTYAQR